MLHCLIAVFPVTVVDIVVFLVTVADVPFLFMERNNFQECN